MASGNPKARRKVADADRLTLTAPAYQAHPWHGVPALAAGGAINVYVEITPGEAAKFELDKTTGHLRLDRPQRFSSLPPALYGFVPQTYSGERVATRWRHGAQGDGDPVDVSVLSERAFTHGAFLLHARPIGGLRVIDGGKVDDKLVAVLLGDVAFGEIAELGDCPPPLVERLEHYFLSYKRPPGAGRSKVRLAGRYGREEALTVIALAIEDYRARFAGTGQG
jgi:inorganic pyrophosphatase